MITHQTCLRLIGLLALSGLGACSRTLVFAERDGVNLAIRADAAARPPIEVNFGLNRVVGTLVPPVAEEGQEPNARPSGQAVNMFSGFQVLRFGTIDPANPVRADLQITTQFASGAAATAIATQPQVVNSVVRTPDRPAGPTLAILRPDVRRLSMELTAMTPQQRRRMAVALGVPGVAALPDPEVNQRLRDLLDDARTDAVKLNRFSASLAQARGS